MLYDVLAGAPSFISSSLCLHIAPWSHAGAMARRCSAASRALACVVALACVAFAGASPESGEQRAPLEQFAVHSVRRQLASGVSLSCNASSVARSGSWVSVTWAFPASGSPSPSATDVLALYVPFDADITRVAPVKFKNVTGARGGSLRRVRGAQAPVVRVAAVASLRGTSAVACAQLPAAQLAPVRQVRLLHRRQRLAGGRGGGASARLC